MTTYNETALLKTVEILWGANAIPIAGHIYSVIDKATKDAFAAGYQAGEAADKRDVYRNGFDDGRSSVAPREFYAEAMDSTRLGKEEVCPGGLDCPHGWGECELEHDSGDEMPELDFSWMRDA